VCAPSANGLRRKPAGRLKTFHFRSSGWFSAVVKSTSRIDSAARSPPLDASPAWAQQLHRHHNWEPGLDLIKPE
jgi:hypothetical protein